MADPDMIERQCVYRAAVKTAGFNKNQLIYLHKASAVQVDKWLWSEKGYPPFHACFELFAVCRRLDFNVPELKRLCNRSSNIRPTDFIAKFFSEEIGKKIFSRNIGGGKNTKYVFSGELQTITTIAQTLGMTRRQLYSRIYAANGRHTVDAGTDITHLASAKKIGRPKK